MGADQELQRGELSRVAEMVLVLAVAGEVRGGADPTAAERAMAAKARCKLTAAVEKVARPRELASREAVCAVVEDLGLGRARDPHPVAMGYRPRRVSIADRVLLTKRKMEEVEETFVHSTTNVPKRIASSAITGSQQGASRSPRILSTPMTSPIISKQSLTNGPIVGASYVKPANIPSIVSLLRVGSADFKVGKDVSGSRVTQSGGTSTIDQEKRSYHLTAADLNQTSIQNSSGTWKYLGKNESAVQSGRGSIVMGHQTASGEFSVHKKSVLSHHKEISNKVVWILYQPSDHPSWTVPSTEYMSTRLDCQICKVSIVDMESLFVCDACEKGMHLKCLKHSVNQGLTRTEWYCPPCLVQSKGKLLPSKYGKVIRTFIAPKTSIANGAAQPCSQDAAESSTKKDCNRAANESATNQNTNEVGSNVHKSSTLALDTASLKPLSISGAGPQKENVKLDETSFIEKGRAAQPCSGIHTETAISCNEGQSSGASTYGSSSLSGSSHMHIKSSSVNSAEDSILQSAVQSGFKHSNNFSVVPSKEKCEGNGTSHQHLSKNVQMSRSNTPTNGIHQADRVVKDGIRTTHKEERTKDAISDNGNVHQVNLNQQICPDHEAIGDRKDGYVGCSTSIVDWVGDALKQVSNKTYYNSCNIDGVIYNLHDHVLFGIEGSKPGPCKLQSLWQDHDSGSRLAMVNPYFFSSDIPESISKPCTDEENEVYGSNDQITVLLTAICGPCEVLHVDRVREETKRRCQLDSSGSRLHPIFFCRWMYDECTNSFYKDYDSDN